MLELAHGRGYEAGGMCSHGGTQSWHSGLVAGLATRRHALRTCGAWVLAAVRVLAFMSMGCGLHERPRLNVSGVGGVWARGVRLWLTRTRGGVLSGFQGPDQALCRGPDV